MSSGRTNSRVENDGLIQLFQIAFIASIIIAFFLLLLLPFNLKNPESLVVSVLALCFNFVTALGSGIALMVLGKKKKNENPGKFNKNIKIQTKS